MTTMTFSGTALVRLHTIVLRAIDDINTEIGMMPDVHRHADDIDELEEERAVYGRLEQRIAKKLGVESIYKAVTT